MKNTEGINTLNNPSIYLPASLHTNYFKLISLFQPKQATAILHASAKLVALTAKQALMQTKTSLKLRTTKQTQPQKYYHHLEPQIFQNHQKLVVMIWERVETAAHNLERTISKYVQTDEEVANFQKILRPLINRIKAGEIHPPIE